MKFSLATVVFAFAASVAALPGGADKHFPVPDDMTVEQASAKCGDKAQLSCCNKATYAGDTTNMNSGLLGGALSSLIGGGSGSEGLGLFDQCSKLNIPVVNLVPVGDLLNKKCQQNIACCQQSDSDAVCSTSMSHWPLLIINRAEALSALACLASLSALSCKRIARLLPAESLARSLGYFIEGIMWKGWIV